VKFESFHTDLESMSDLEKFKNLNFNNFGSIFDEMSAFDKDLLREVDPYILMPFVMFSEEVEKIVVFPCNVTRDLFLVPQTLNMNNLDPYFKLLAKFYLLTLVKVHNAKVFYAEQERVEKVGKTEGGYFLN
jgi:hypothetical protein